MHTCFLSSGFKKAWFLCMGTLLLCSCSIEDEYAEKISVQNEDHKLYASPEAQNFARKTEACLLGDDSLALSLLDLFSSSLPISGNSSLIYQDPDLVHEFENCLRKTDLNNGSSLYLYYVPPPEICAEIAARFCKQGNSRACAFWIRRIINQRGAVNGYETAGRIFIKYKETLTVGSQMLSEAAKRGSREAALILIRLSSGEYE